MVGCIDTDLLSRFSCRGCGKAAIEYRRHVVPIQRYSIGNSLRKLVKKFYRDPTVGSIDMYLLTRYSRPVGGMAPTGLLCLVLSIPRDSIEKSLRKLLKKI